MFKFVLLLSALVSGSLKAAPIDLHQDFSGRQFGHDLSVFLDSTGSKQVADMGQQTFTPSQKMTPNFGFTRDILWVSFELHNPLDHNKSVFLEYKYASADRVELFQKNGIDEYSSLLLGDQIPFDLRPIKSRYPVFELNVPPGVHRYFLRIDTEGTTIAPLFFWEKEAFWFYIIKDSLLLGTLFGLQMAMLLYNAFLLFSFRTRLYFYYIAYIGFFILHAISAQGLSYMILGSDDYDHWWSNQGFLVFAELATIFMVLFGIRFLDMRNRHPLIYKLCLLHRAIALLDIVNIQFHSYEIGAKIANLNVGFAAILMLTAGTISISKRYRPAYFYTLAWALYLFGSVIMVLKYQGVLPLNTITEYANLFGACAEAILISIALGDRVNHYRNKAEAEIRKLNGDLKQHIEHVEDLVEEKTRDIRSILKNIHQGIFMIESDGRMHAEYSDYLHSILGEKPNQLEPAFNILFRHAKVDPDTRSMNQNIIDTSLNTDVINFEANQTHLLREMQIKRADGLHDLEMDWVPIVVDEIRVTKLLVSVRDVTEIKQLTRESHENRRALDLIERIIGFPPAKFDSFYESAKDLLASSQRILDAQEMDSDKARYLYRNLHTLKGLSRAFGFKELSVSLHEMEQLLQDAIKKQQNAIASAPLYLAFQPIDEGFQELFFINYTRLGREFAKQEHKPAEMRNLIASINSLVSAIERGTPQIGLNQLKETLVNDLFFNLNYLLQDLTNSLDKSVERLKIKKPMIKVHGDNFHFYPSYHHQIKSVFMHLITNSLTHGFDETTDGFIQMEVTQKGRMLQILYQDNGRGINMKKIRQIASTRIPDVAQRTDAEIAQLIFDSGFTTRDHVDEFAGRGVGMDVVRTSLEEIGGQIQVVLDNSLQEACAVGFSPLSFKIQLPADVFLGVAEGMRKAA